MKINNVPENIQKKANAAARKAGFGKATEIVSDKRRTEYAVISGSPGYHAKKSNGTSVSNAYAMKYPASVYYKKATCTVAVPFLELAVEIAKKQLSS